MRLDLRFSNRPPEDLWCQAVGILVFEGPNMITGVIAGLNKKMAGYLSRLMEDGRWTGQRGEKFLLATQDMIRADKLLLHGLGPVSEFDAGVLVREVTELGSTFDRMDINEFGVCIPLAEIPETDTSSCLERSAVGLVEKFLVNHEEDPDFLLKIIFSIGSEFADRVDSVVNRLRGRFSKMQNFSIIMDRKPVSTPNA